MNKTNATITDIRAEFKSGLISLFNDVKRYRDGAELAYSALDGNATKDLESTLFFTRGEAGELNMTDERPEAIERYAEIDVNWGAMWDGCNKPLDELTEDDAQDAAEVLCADCIYSIMARIEEDLD